MKQRYSLKSPLYFSKLINIGNKKRNKFLFCAWKKAEEFKVGISVPKKLGNAVFRNKQKRHCKEIIRDIEIDKINIHAVIILRKEFTTKTFLEKNIIIRNIFKEILNETKRNK